MSENPASTSQSANPDAGHKRLLRASGVTGMMTMVSRVLGLTRDVVIARVFGVGDGTDAFFLANRIPNFLRRLFAEGAFNQAFVPVLSEYRSQKPHAEVQELINAVAGTLGLILLAVTLVVVAAAPYISIPVAYGFLDQPDKFQLFVQMLRLTFPYLLLISLTAFCGAILNSYDRFAVPALTPALLNVSLIACAFLLAPYMNRPELALAWGVLIAGVVQLLFQLPFLARIQLFPVPRLQRGHTGVRQVIKLMGPALFGVSVSQINLLLDAFIASLLMSNAVSWLYYSDRLVELPLGVFGIAIATVVLPSLSRRHAEQSLAGFASTLDWAMRLICLIAIPASLALIVIAEPILITLFQNDQFSVTDVERVTMSLQAYALGLIAYMGVKIFAPGYFARQDTSTPVRIGIVAMVTNMVLNLVLVFGFSLQHVGLALATSLAAFVNAGLLFLGLWRDRLIVRQPGWLLFAVRLVVANTAMVLFLHWFSGDWRDWLEMELWVRILRLLLACGGGFLIYVASLYVTGMRVSDLHR
ncbi:MAG: murein biosynthesis integral membrane protein MurJ [Gammaproteobacteria bacterium]|nr:murein biosynthesis integral membrane protein MurJ [Pseudomonadales bacterium]MCP5346481.1 murein biosynthesis integral membrane protein MurJ [Pseudomonadales bacterium]